MKPTKKPLRTPRLGPEIQQVKSRRAGPHKHRNTPRGGAKKADHHEGW